MSKKLTQLKNILEDFAKEKGLMFEHMFYTGFRCQPYVFLQFSNPTTDCVKSYNVCELIFIHTSVHAEAERIIRAISNTPAMITQDIIDATNLFPERRIFPTGRYATEIMGLFNKRNTHQSKPSIKEVMFNNPATIVFWSDDTKTVVKAKDGEQFDKEKGLAMAISKKFLGNKYEYYNEFEKWISESEDKVETKTKDVINCNECMFADLDIRTAPCKGCFAYGRFERKEK